MTAVSHFVDLGQGFHATSDVYPTLVYFLLIVSHKPVPSELASVLEEHRNYRVEVITTGKTRVSCVGLGSKLDL